MSKYTFRTATPAKTNKYYLKKGYGGYNPCVLGNVKHRYCKGSVLVNCVGAATGFFNEIIGKKKCSYLGNTNAKNFWSLAKKQGLERGTTPRPGSIAVWSSSGAGHVAGVADTTSSTAFKSFESGWGYTNSYTTSKARAKGTGNWGMSASYKFVGFIYNPSVPNTYKVKKGDTLSKIAKDEGLTVTEIAKWNGIKDANVIKVGQKLTLVEKFL